MAARNSYWTNIFHRIINNGCLLSPACFPSVYQSFWIQPVDGYTVLQLLCLHGCMLGSLRPQDHPLFKYHSIFFLLKLLKNKFRIHWSSNNKNWKTYVYFKQLIYKCPLLQLMFAIYIWLLDSIAFKHLHYFNVL